MQSKATTVRKYLAEFPKMAQSPRGRSQVVLKNLIRTTRKGSSTA